MYWLFDDCDQWFVVSFYLHFATKNVLIISLTACHNGQHFFFDLRIAFSGPLAPYATGWPSWSSEYPRPLSEASQSITS